MNEAAHASDDEQIRPAIDASNLRLTYSDGTTAVDGVDLRVPEGEFFGFLGPNGAGKTAAEVFRISVQVAIILGLGVVLGAEIATGVVGALGIVAVGVLFSLWFLALSNSLAILTRDQESTIIAANLLQFPLLFLSSAFLPLDALPEWIQTFARFNPVTYGVDAARSLMLDRNTMTVLDVSWFEGALNGIAPGVAVLVGLDLVLGTIAVYLLSRASSSDVK